MEQEVQFPSSIIKTAISLEDLGINELAWKWEDIPYIIEFLVENDYAILGGDVYLLKNKQKIITYDNWYIDEETGVSWSNYVKKSKKIAIEYVNNYYKKNGNNYCYSIVYSKNSLD